ncbi:DNA-binding SARP family transcriptional activator [Crossiella equi]|uniref:DNA-binding SARP family transcriptional activator n=1 Tax=Crossiella equi TaxID=130796 RepID=A0ABS5ASE9_9PSEU|nr:BTAD domain-containing putative transcriptional regulator [Crossiella equi]MBP2479147.1 DNA-binding SARP family transcriptional activator [Crossiella equi]
MRFGVLGPLVAHGADGPVPLKGPRHRAVLARLLIARGRVVPVRVLVDDLWPDPPDGAVGAVQTFVGDLRRVLEPGRAPRTPARLLVTEGSGYALRLPPDAVDAWRFEAGLALSTVEEALGLWRGPAYAEFADQPWALAEVARLEELRLHAVELRAQAWLAAGRADAVAAELRAHVTEQPWRENGWRLLALALYRAGRQGDALAALREARAALVEGLGVDPGGALRALEADILGQDPGLDPVVPTGPTLVGRDGELAALASATHLALVSGEPGIGKTTLAEAFCARLRDVRVAWGRSPETGAPPHWPWTQVLTALGGGPAPAERLQWQREVIAFVAARAPVVLVFDDLHWAGGETLDLVTALVGERVPGVLVLATHREDPRLTAFLGRVARFEPVRVRLAGLTEAAVRELVPDGLAPVIHRRSGGNPFFVRELVRAGGDLVPEGVRDLVRHRLGALSDVELLRRAAVFGTGVEVDLLSAHLGEDRVLDGLDTAVRHGFLVEDGPRRVRFEHALVRDAVYEEVSLARRARWHREAAELLHRERPHEVTAIAEHFLLAGDRSPEHAVRAARDAEGQHAPHEAARWWRVALDLEPRLDLVMGLVRALAVTGDLAAARAHRTEALDRAEATGAPAVVARVIGAFDVPGIWTANDDPAMSARLVEVAERTLTALPDDRDRARLLATIAMELRGGHDDRGDRAAREAEAIARRLGDPGLLAFALNGRFMHTCHRAGLAPERAALGRELLEVAGDLVSFRVLGHLVLLQAHSALADLATADRHATAVDVLGDRHGLPLVGVFTDWYRALRLVITGQPAEAAYRAAARRLDGSGMPGLERGLLPLALLCQQPEVDLDQDWGPHLDWVRPLALPVDQAREAAHALPEPPRDLLLEARLCLLARAALRLGDRELLTRAYEALRPAEAELAGAGSGLLSFGPVRRYLAELRAAIMAG